MSFRIVQKQERGFTLASVVFLLTAIAALGAYMATLSTTQQLTTAQSVLGGRADFAARSGVEWAISNVVNSGAAGLNCAPGTVTFALAGGATAGFSVDVTCNSQSVTEGGGPPYVVYNLTVTASKGSLGDIGYVSRTLVAAITP